MSILSFFLSYILILSLSLSLPPSLSFSLPLVFVTRMAVTSFRELMRVVCANLTDVRADVQCSLDTYVAWLCVYECVV